MPEAHGPPADHEIEEGVLEGQGMDVPDEAAAPVPQPHTERALTAELHGIGGHVRRATLSTRSKT